MDFEVKCLLCGGEAGELVGGIFRQHPACAKPLPRRSGEARCCRCGGSLYFEPLEGRRRPLSPAELRELFAEDGAAASA